MIKFIYVVRVEEHDYFDAFRRSYNPIKEYEFDSLEEAFGFYKEQQKHDVCYPGDHTRTTFKPKQQIDFYKERQEKHGFVRGHAVEYPWELESFYSHRVKANDEVRECSDPDILKVFELDQPEDDTILF